MCITVTVGPLPTATSPSRTEVGSRLPRQSRQLGTLRGHTARPYSATLHLVCSAPTHPDVTQHVVHQGVLLLGDLVLGFEAPVETHHDGAHDVVLHGVPDELGRVAEDGHEGQHEDDPLVVGVVLGGLVVIPRRADRADSGVRHLLAHLPEQSVEVSRCQTKVISRLAGGQVQAVWSKNRRNRLHR